MKKILLSFAVLAVAGAAFVGAKTLSAKSDASLLMQNVEALAKGETTSNGDITIVWEHKNKWGGLASGCKAKPQHTCTVKNPSWPNLNF